MSQTWPWQIKAANWICICVHKTWPAKHNCRALGKRYTTVSCLCVRFAQTQTRVFEFLRVLFDSRPCWGLAIAPFSICCHTAHIVIPQFKGTLSGFKDLFKALILIGRGLFCHIKRGREEAGGIMQQGWQRFLRVEDWQRICGVGRTEIWNIGHRMPAVIDMK